MYYELGEEQKLKQIADHKGFCTEMQRKTLDELYFGLYDETKEGLQTFKLSMIKMY